jgi:CHAD domain-containing protein
MAATRSFSTRCGVGLRRLRSALRAFRRLVPHGKSRALSERFGKLMPFLGSARDWDVFCDGLAQLASHELELAPAMGRLLAEAREKRAAARRAARRAISSPAFQALLLRALRWLHDAPWKKHAPEVSGSLVAFGAEALGRLHAKALHQAHGIEWRDTQRRHRLRIRIKRLRYASDFLAPCFAQASVRPYMKRLQALQDVLGELNDIAVARRLLAEIAPSGSDPAIATATRSVRKRLAVREDGLILALEPVWRAFEKRRPFWAPPR